MECHNVSDRLGHPVVLYNEPARYILSTFLIASGSEFKLLSASLQRHRPAKIVALRVRAEPSNHHLFKI